MVAAYAIHAALLALTPCWADRDDSRKAGQLETIAVAIATVASTVDDAAGLIAIANSESKFSLRVHAGLTGGRGRGLWQLELGSRRKPPFVGLSLADTTHAAGEALWMWRHSWQCGRTLAARFTAYAGRECDTVWPTLHERVNTYYYARGRILRALEEA